MFSYCLTTFQLFCLFSSLLWTIPLFIRTSDQCRKTKASVVSTCYKDLSTFNILETELDNFRHSFGTKRGLNTHHPRVMCTCRQTKKGNYKINEWIDGWMIKFVVCYTIFYLRVLNVVVVRKVQIPFSTFISAHLAARSNFTVALVSTEIRMLSKVWKKESNKKEPWERAEPTTDGLPTES